MKVLIGILLWILFIPLNLGAVLVGYVLAPVIVLFCDKDGWLPKWLWWFQTPDNSMDGDGGWKREHWQWRFELPEPLCTYVGRVGWAWRNPVYGFSLSVLAARPKEIPFTWFGNPDIRNASADKEAINGWLIVTSGIYWNVYIIAPFFSRTFRLYLGWKLRSGEGREVYQYVLYMNPFKSRG